MVNLRMCAPSPGLPLHLSWLAASLAAGCVPSGEAEPSWAGTIDTLASGQVVVTNTADPLWTPEATWRVTEELRIGSRDEVGPSLFGEIMSLEIDPLERIYVLEGQAQEIRVFAPDGAHVRTIGRQGGGPGEFNRPLHAQFGPDGHLWVVDPANNRVSVIDTVGALLDSHASPGGFVMIPWPGGFDDAGRYYAPVPRPDEERFEIALVRYDAGFTALDTLTVPDDPVERERFVLRSPDGGVAMASVPFSAAFRWRLAPSGSIWGMLSGNYRFFELTPEGDTLRTLTREFDPLPVTGADMAEAEAELEWFTDQGGKVDLSKIPDTKPATEEFLFDDEGNLWVFPVTKREDQGTRLDVFDPIGRYLGRVRLPFALSRRPYPLIRGSTLVGVTEDELEVPFVVRARIEKSSP
jgi:hypothetical protein